MMLTVIKFLGLYGTGIERKLTPSAASTKHSMEVFSYVGEQPD